MTKEEMTEELEQFYEKISEITRFHLFSDFRRDRCPCQMDFRHLRR